MVSKVTVLFLISVAVGNIFYFIASFKIIMAGPEPIAAAARILFPFK